MRRYIAEHLAEYIEFLGTSALVLTVGCSVLGARPLAPLAIGGVLAVMVYAGGHISGGHYNPAVSLAVWVRGRLASRDLLLYWAAQLVGALLGAVLAHFLIDTRGHATRGHATTPTGRDAAVVLLAEFLFTFLLGYVVLNVATSHDNEHNGFYGVAVGTTVMAGAIAVGPLTGGAFNPAVVAGRLGDRAFLRQQHLALPPGHPPRRRNRRWRLPPAEPRRRRPSPFEAGRSCQGRKRSCLTEINDRVERPRCSSTLGRSSVKPDVAGVLVTARQDAIGAASGITLDRVAAVDRWTTR